METIYVIFGMAVIVILLVIVGIALWKGDRRDQ